MSRHDTLQDWEFRRDEWDAQEREARSPVDGPRICIKCGHEERFSDNEGGTCEKIVDEEANFCCCVCMFA